MPCHREQRRLPFTPEQLFALVADMERYPEFLPWCVKVQTLEQDENYVKVEMTVGYKRFNETFRSCVTLDHPREIKVCYGGGALKHLCNEWRFTPVSTDEGIHCDIDFYVDFDLKSRLLSGLMEAFFEQAFKKMVDAFETRARLLYRCGRMRNRRPIQRKV